VAGEFRQRQHGILLAFIVANPVLDSQGDVARSGNSFGQSGILYRIARVGIKDIHDDLAGAQTVEVFDQLALGRTRPRPAANLPQARIVDLDQYNVAADRLAAHRIPANAQAVFEQFAETGQAEDDGGQKRPQQKPQPLVRPVRGLVCRCQAHPASKGQRTRAHLCACKG
jgi:hypothetical protein